MKAIQKKSWPKIFKLVKSGKKRFDVRVADFRIKEGDVFVMREWNPKKKVYTGRQIKKKAKYILKFKLDDFGQKKLIEKKGLYIIQF